MGSVEEVKSVAEPQSEVLPKRLDGYLTPEEARKLYSGKEWRGYGSQQRIPSSEPLTDGPMKT